MNKWIRLIAGVTALSSCTSPEERSRVTYLNPIEHATVKQTKAPGLIVELNDWMELSDPPASTP
jgi:hypothetical protein